MKRLLITLILFGLMVVLIGCASKEKCAAYSDNSNYFEMQETITVAPASHYALNDEAEQK
jgi:uncharacterized lipoprotein YehR (DUF1307 family)